MKGGNRFAGERGGRKIWCMTTTVRTGGFIGFQEQINAGTGEKEQPTRTHWATSNSLKLCDTVRTGERGIQQSQKICGSQITEGPSRSLSLLSVFYGARRLE